MNKYAFDVHLECAIWVETKSEDEAREFVQSIQSYELNAQFGGGTAELTEMSVARDAVEAVGIVDGKYGHDVELDCVIRVKANSRAEARKFVESIEQYPLDAQFSRGRATLTYMSVPSGDGVALFEVNDVLVDELEGLAGEPQRQESLAGLEFENLKRIQIRSGDGAVLAELVPFHMPVAEAYGVQLWVGDELRGIHSPFPCACEPVQAIDTFLAEHGIRALNGDEAALLYAGLLQAEGGADWRSLVLELGAVVGR